MKRYIEDGLCRELNLFHVEVPLIVTRESGVNDYLDRDGSRTPIEFPCGLGLETAVDVRRSCRPPRSGRGWPCGSSTARSARASAPTCAPCARTTSSTTTTAPTSTSGTGRSVITAADREPRRPQGHGPRIWKVIKGAETLRPGAVPEAEGPDYPNLPEELTFLHAEEILEMYPDLPRKQRETQILQEYPAVFIIGIGWVLEGRLSRTRCARPTTTTGSRPPVTKNGEQTHGLNGDILVWNPVTKRRHELSSMGIRVTKDTLKQQLEISGQTRLPEAAVSPGDPERPDPAVASAAASGSRARRCSCSRRRTSAR